MKKVLYFLSIKKRAYLRHTENSTIGRVFNKNYLKLSITNNWPWNLDSVPSPCTTELSVIN